MKKNIVKKSLTTINFLVENGIVCPDEVVDLCLNDLGQGSFMSMREDWNANKRPMLTATAIKHPQRIYMFVL